MRVCPQREDGAEELLDLLSARNMISSPGNFVVGVVIILFLGQFFKFFSAEFVGKGLDSFMEVAIYKYHGTWKSAERDNKALQRKERRFWQYLQTDEDGD